MKWNIYIFFKMPEEELKELKKGIYFFKFTQKILGIQIYHLIFSWGKKTMGVSPTTIWSLSLPYHFSKILIRILKIRKEEKYHDSDFNLKINQTFNVA